MRDATLSGKPAMSGARRMHIHGKLVPMDEASLIGRWRAIAAEAREPVDLEDDPANRSGWGDSNPNIAMGIALVAASLAIILGNFAFLP